MRYLGLVSALALLTGFGAAAGCSSDTTTTGTGASSQGGTTQTGGQGGAPQGGGGQGGGGQGGIHQGGTTQTGGQGGAQQGGGGQGGGGQGGMAVAEAECSVLGECKLVNDCCTCAAIPQGEPAPACANQDCAMLMCAQLGFNADAVMCAAHRCVAGFNCDHSQVACLSPEPSCGAGKTAAVKGMCWGECVPASECAFVSECSQCTKPGQVCAAISMGPVEHRYCIEVPEECGNTPTCACMGASVCGGLPCELLNGELTCMGQ
jgi:hypothetical protein